MSRATRGTARKIATQRGWSRILRCMKATLTTAAAVLLLLAAAPASAGPTDQLREYTEQVIKVLDDPALARQDRRAAVRKIAHEAFDVTETAKRMVERGMGLAFLPHLAVGRELRRRSLVAIEIVDAEPISRSLDVIHPRPRPLSSEARALLHALRSALSEAGGPPRRRR